MSGGKIYIIREDETLQALSEQEYASENLLQVLLAKYPDLLAGDLEIYDWIVNEIKAL
jgi:hypothetical protein